jgi:hypothetical protein
MSRSDYIHAGCDNDVLLEGATNADTGNYMNAATVTFTLYKSIVGSEVSGDAVAGATTIAMAYVAASNGNYLGIIQSTVALVVGDYYWIVVDYAQGGIVGKKRWQVQVVDEGKEAG